MEQNAGCSHADSQATVQSASYVSPSLAQQPSTSSTPTQDGTIDGPNPIGLLQRFSRLSLASKQLPSHEFLHIVTSHDVGAVVGAVVGAKVGSTVGDVLGASVGVLSAMPQHATGQASLALLLLVPILSHLSSGFNATQWHVLASLVLALWYTQNGSFPHVLGQASRANLPFTPNQLLHLLRTLSAILPTW